MSGQPFIAVLSLALLDVVAVYLFGVLSFPSPRGVLIRLPFRLSGSSWLVYLAALGTRRAAYLLEEVGSDPWLLGWGALWQGPVLYWGTRARMTRIHLGPLIYVGETEDVSRRLTEHMLRVLLPFGHTQQAFYTVMRQDSRDAYVIRSLVCD